MLNYGLLAWVRAWGQRLLRNQPRMVREAALVKPLWAVTTLHTLLALLLPPLLLPSRLAAADPPPLHCCVSLDRYRDQPAARHEAHLRAVEDYSTGTPAYLHRRRSMVAATRPPGADGSTQLSD